MRRRCAVLLALPAAAAAICFVLAPAAPAGASSPAAGSAYPWVQPWQVHGAVVPDVGCSTQPPASVTICAQAPVVPAAVVTAGGMDTSYPWVQPWAIPAGSAGAGHWTQPPAFVPTG